MYVGSGVFDSILARHSPPNFYKNLAGLLNEVVRRRAKCLEAALMRFVSKDQSRFMRHH